MKNAGSLSRSELLSWINSHVEKAIGPVRRIEDLGNGAAYLILLASLHPEVVRSEKIIRHPGNHHECLHNLRQLATGFQKLQLGIHFQLEKIAMSKYQDNYALACQIRKAFPDQAPTDKKENTVSNNRSPLPSRIKVKAPERPVRVALKKEETPMPTVEEVQQLQDSNSHRKMKEIDCVMKESKTDREKLERIAAILNLRGKQTGQTVGTMTQEGPSNTSSLSIEASYKRFLRPSLFQKSTFLNKEQPQSFEKTEHKPLQSSFPRQPENEIIPVSSEFEGEMLLSQKKEASEREAEPEKEKEQEQEEVPVPVVPGEQPVVTEWQEEGRSGGEETTLEEVV